MATHACRLRVTMRISEAFDSGTSQRHGEIRGTSMDLMTGEPMPPLPSRPSAHATAGAQLLPPRRSRPLLLVGCLLLSGLAASLPGAEDPALRSQADALIAAAMTAMKESSSTPGRAVDAILLFDQVLALDKKLGDVDQECDMQANIFWCRKHLNIDEVKTYLAQKGSTKPAEAVLAELKASSDQPLAPSDAETYFTRAHTYAQEHPERPLQIAIRYFEVAERFQGTPAGLNAQRLSLEAQQLAISQESHQAETLFSKHEAAGDPSARAAVPGAEALKTATASIKDTFKAEYASVRRRDRVALVATLTAQASATSDDAAMRYALLDQARELAIAAADASDLLAVCDQLAAAFSGVDAAATKKAALARIHSLPAAAAMIRLLATPDDADANTIVGRYYGIELQQWPTALPLLARGGDAPLKKLASMELSAPTAAEHQAEIGDGWYSEAKKGGEAGRDALYARALHWYEQAEGGLTGMSKTAVAKHILEIKGLILMNGITDWDNLTQAQWDRIRSPIFEVAMSKARNEVPAQAIPDYPARILASPGDSWHISAMGQDVAVSAKGDAQRTIGSFQAGELVMELGAGMPSRLGELTQATPLSLMAATSLTAGPQPGAGGGGGRRGGGGRAAAQITPVSGVIRVKFLAIDGH
jgi:hypothetical protein